MDRGIRTSQVKVLIIGLNNQYYIAITTERVMVMYIVKNIHGHIQVYDNYGNFLFSADTEREAREELKEYAQSAA